MRTPALVLTCLIALSPLPAAAQENLSAWPILVNPFESTGGGGVMIDEYRPVTMGENCATNFSVRLPDGAVTRGLVVFDAVAREGGILCTNGRWSTLDGAAQGTTPFQVFIKDGIVRRQP